MHLKSINRNTLVRVGDTFMHRGLLLKAIEQPEPDDYPVCRFCACDKDSKDNVPTPSNEYLDMCHAAPGCDDVVFINTAQTEPDLKSLLALQGKL